MENIVEKLKRDRIRDSTKTNYYSVWKTFNEFFIRLDNKPNSWEERIVLFVGYLVQTNKKSQTIKSYISAIKAVLREDNVILNEDKFLLNALTKACKLKNDTVRTRLPISKGILELMVKEINKFYSNIGQTYLQILYIAVFTTAYYGLFRVGELGDSPHAIKVNDVHIGDNKKKLLFILRSSKTHGRHTKPQMVKISSTAINKSNQKLAAKLPTTCPYEALRRFVAIRPGYNHKSENFFVFRDRTPVSQAQMRKVLKDMLKNAGLDERLYNFHSIRIGRSVDLMKMMIPIPMIRKLGRWSSNCVYTYLKNY